MNFVLVQDKQKTKQLIYSVSKMFKGTKLRYQKIERLALAVVITIRKLRL